MENNLNEDNASNPPSVVQNEQLSTNNNPSKDNASTQPSNENKENSDGYIRPFGCVVWIAVLVGIVFLTIWWFGFIKQHKWWEILLVWLGLTIIGVPIGTVLTGFFDGGKSDKK